MSKIIPTRLRHGSVPAEPEVREPVGFCQKNPRTGGCRSAKGGREDQLAASFLPSRFSYDCPSRTEARSRKGKSACGVYLPDVEQPRPPAAPRGTVKLSLLKKT